MNSNIPSKQSDKISKTNQAFKALTELSVEHSELEADLIAARMLLRRIHIAHQSLQLALPPGLLAEVVNLLGPSQDDKPTEHIMSEVPVEGCHCRNCECARAAKDV